MPARPIRVAIVAAYPTVRAGLAELLRGAGFEVVTDGDASLDTPGNEVDVAVVDGADGSTWEGGPPAVYLAEPGAMARRLATASAEAWLPRDASATELAVAVQAVAAGMVVLHPAFGMLLRDARPDEADPARDLDDAHLTAREHEVLRLLAAGMTNKAIARALTISEHTVKFHVGALLSKLDASSRTEAVTAAARRGLLTL